MKKRALSWILIFSMLVTQCISIPQIASAVTMPKFSFNAYADWSGNNPKAGDSEFYIELKGTNLNDLSAEVGTDIGSGFTPVASQTNRWYLGKTSVGEDRYIYKMVVDGGNELSSGTTYYIYLKDIMGNYFTDDYAYFNCSEPFLFAVANIIPKEVSTVVNTIPFEINLSGADGHLNKENITLKLYSGTKEGFWEAPTIVALIGAAQEDDYDIIVTGCGEYLLKGEITVTNSPIAGDKLYLEIDYSGNKTYVGTPVYVISETGLGQFKLSNAFPGIESTGGHEAIGSGYEGVGNATYYLSNVTTSSTISAHKFTLTGGNLSNPSLLTVADNNGNNILRTNTIEVTGPLQGVYTATGMIEIPNGINSVGFKYNGIDLHTVTVARTDVQGSVSLTPVDYVMINGTYSLPAETTDFQAVLSGVNFPGESTSYSAIIIDNKSGDETEINCEVESIDGQTLFNLSSSKPLYNAKNLSIRLNGEEISTLNYEGGVVVPGGGTCITNIIFGDFYSAEEGSVMAPALTRISGNRDIMLFGEGFSSSKEYTAHFMEHNVSGLSSMPQQFPATYVSGKQLTISKTHTDGLARGWYEVYLKENGTQINGFYETVLLPEKDIVQVINPTVKLNTGESFTAKKQVTISMTAGSFAYVRFSENKSELSDMPYITVEDSVGYILSEGYGNKTIYFEFKSSEGNTYNTTASIEYRAASFPGPSICGVAGITKEEQLLLNKYENYNLYMQAEGVGNIAKVDLSDALGNVLYTHTLNRTSGIETLYTFSKLVNFSDENVKKLRFYTTDSFGVNSEYTDIELSVVEVPYITYYRADIVTCYIGVTRYAQNGSDISYTIKGKTGHNATATVTYKDAASTLQHQVVSLIEKIDNDGLYTGKSSIPSDAAELVSIDYKITNPENISVNVTKVEERRLPVTVVATFNGLDNAEGDYDGKYLRIYTVDESGYTDKIVRTATIGSNQTEIVIGRLVPGSYHYSVFDSFNTYKKGTFVTESGNGVLIDLSGTNKPASITFNVIGAELSPEAFIKYSYSKDNRTYYSYAKPNEPNLGFYDGMIIDSYELVMGYYDLKIYESPQAVTMPTSFSSGANSVDINVIELSKAKLTITVNDSSVKGRVVPGTTVSASQTIKNGSANFYISISGTTDDKGQVTLELYPELDVYIQATKNNYNNTSMIYGITADESQNANIMMTYSDQNRVKVISKARPLLEPNEEFDDTQLIETDSSIAYLSATDTDGTRLGTYTGYDSIVFMGDVQNKTVRIYPVMKQGFVSEKEFYTLELDEYGNGTISVVAIPKGAISADIKNSGVTSPKSYMLIYNEKGYLVDSIAGAEGRISSETQNINEGNYSIIFLSSYDLTNLNGISDIHSLENYGLVENVHYVKKSITLESGIMKYLGDINIQKTITKDMLVPYTVIFDTKFVPVSGDGSGGKIYVKAKVVVSELLKNSLMIKSIIAYDDNSNPTYDKAVNGIPSIFGSQDYTPDLEGNYTITYTENADTNKQQTMYVIRFGFERVGVIDSAKSAAFMTLVETPRVSITVPKQVVKPITEITVRGNGLAYSKVEIYDGEILVGSAEANYKHSYSIVVPLLSPEINALHSFTAKLTTKNEDVYTSAPAYCEVIDGDERATISNYQFKNIAHFSSIDDEKVKEFDVSDLGNMHGGVYTYYPSGLSRVTFRINKLVSAQIENVYVINTDKDGIKTKFPAKLVKDDADGDYSDWKMEAVIGPKINNLSIFYSIKDGENFGKITGYNPPTENEFAEALNNIDKIEPAEIPKKYRDPNEAIITEQTDTSLKAHKEFDGGKVGIEVKYSNTVGYNSQQLTAQGFLKIPVGNSGEYYLIKDSSSTSGYDLRIERTMYLSEGLASMLTEGTTLAEGVETILASQSPQLFAADTNSPTLYAASSTSDTVRNIAGKIDYVGYLEGTGEIAYEAFRNRTANLGKLGTGLQVIGGAAAVAQIFSGPGSIDPANLKSLISKIKDNNVRSRIGDEIWEYQKARTDSHSISSLMSVVSYSSSFFLLPGKCLSYVVSTGSMIYNGKIDAEYNIWGNGILAEITMQLRKEEKDIGEEDDPDDPIWIMDPSGYVFEAVDNQRVEGVTATAQTEIGGGWSTWNDEVLLQSEQENPQTTDMLGKYGWDVPVGDWRVLFEDSTNKYLTTTSKAMTVPPAHTEVNIGLLSTVAPQVLNVAVDPTGLEIEFSKYMQAESIYDIDSNMVNVQVYETVGNEIVPCKKIDFIVCDENTGYVTDRMYQSDVISSKKFVKRIRFNADTELYPGGFKLYEDDGITPKQYTAAVSGNVLSYSGVALGSDYTNTNVFAAVRQAVAEPTASIKAGSYTDKQTVSLSTVTTGAEIYYTTNGKTPTSTSAKYTIPITISESCVLKAIASKVGMDDSNIFSATFKIGAVMATEPDVDDDEDDDEGESSGGGGTKKSTPEIVLKEPIIVEMPAFKDVSKNDWYYESVKYAVEKGLFKGISDDEFAPNENMTRAMLVTVLYRLAGSPSVKGTSFKDVEMASWYENAVIWALKNDIISGYGNEIFGSYDNITREQMSAILYRYAKINGYDISVSSDISNFTDADKVSSWAITSMKWMVSNGLLKGKTNNVLDPKGNATRAELATILHRFLENIK